MKLIVDLKTDRITIDANENHYQMDWLKVLLTVLSLGLLVGVMH